MPKLLQMDMQLVLVRKRCDLLEVTPIRSICLTRLRIVVPFSLIATHLNIAFSIELLPKTKKFGCMGRGDLTSLFFSKVVKYYKSRETYLLTWKIRRVYESTVRPTKIMP